MSFDEQPDDPHGECAAEIHRLRALNAELLAMVERCASECAECDGQGNSKLSALHPEECRACADIRALIAIVKRYEVECSVEQQTKEPFNGLSPAHAEVLAILAEECGELVQAGTKILRHGILSRHPESEQVTNKDMLEKEMGDVQAGMRMVCEAGIADRISINLQARSMLARLGRWLHHARPVYVEPGEKIL